MTNKDHLIKTTQKNLESINSSVIQEESETIAYLHDSYVKNKLFYKKLSDVEIVFNINILSKKITLLEETLSRITYADKSTLMARLVILSICIWWAISSCQELYQSYTEFILKNFKNVYFSSDIIEKLPSITISQEEKDYLDTFSFENIDYRYVVKSYFSMKEAWNLEDKINNKIAHLSSIEKEKLKYIALRSTITDFKWGAPLHLLACFGPLIINLSLSIQYLKELMYKINTETELKTNKHLYNLLKKESKDRHLSLVNY